MPIWQAFDVIYIFHAINLSLDAMLRSLLAVLILPLALPAAANPVTREVPLDEMAFTHHTAGLEFEEVLEYRKGLVVFEKLWGPLARARLARPVRRSGAAVQRVSLFAVPSAQWPGLCAARSARLAESCDAASLCRAMTVRA